MSRDNDREQELLEAARALAIELGYVEEDDNEELVDQSLLDDDDEEGMDIAREEIQALIDEESDLVELFEGKVDLVLEYIGKVLKEARPA